MLVTSNSIAEIRNSSITSCYTSGENGVCRALSKKLGKPPAPSLPCPLSLQHACPSLVSPLRSALFSGRTCPLTPLCPHVSPLCLLVGRTAEASQFMRTPRS